MSPVSSQRIVLIALGSNLGHSVALIDAACEKLQLLSMEPLRKSSLWTTTPVDCPPDSPLFTNAAVAFTSTRDETPESLLAKLQALEKELGRLPKIVLNEPRRIDLDLIAFGDEVRSTLALILPHPRAHLRRFVLQPLSEVAPEFILPGQDRTVRELLDGLPPDRAVVRL